MSVWMGLVFAVAAGFVLGSAITFVLLTTTDIGDELIDRDD